MPEISKILAQAAENYGFVPAEGVALSGGHFSYTYEFSRGDDRFVLRITPPNDEIDVHAMQAILNWLGFLVKQGASVPSPLRSGQGNLIESVEFENKTYIFAAFKKVEGTLAESLFPDRWNDDLTSALGHAVGRMHAISRGYYPEDERLLRPTWDRIINCFNPAEELDANHLPIRKKQQEVTAIIQSLAKDEGSFGLIHTDLHFANFVVDETAQSVTIIDFDDCSYGWYVMDIAMLLLDLTVLHRGRDLEAYSEDFLKRFLRSYLEEYSLDQYWIEMLPNFLKLLEIGLYTMLYQGYDPNDSGSWVGRFMSGRKQRIENEVPFIEIDFGSLAEQIASQN